MHCFTICFCVGSCTAVTALCGRLTIDYPTPYVLFQRDSEAGGVLRVRGKGVDPAAPSPVEARFSGGPWKVLDANPKDGRFAGSIEGQTGQGRLEVRCSARPNNITEVEPIAVGDLFVVTGQSNADGRGTVHVKLSADNPYLGVKYRGGTWSRGDDPSDNAGKHGSPWPIVLDTLIPELNVPLGFIQAAVGSTVVRQWRGGGALFDRMEKLVRSATDGTMRVKAVVYYQGENDITHYNKLSVLGDYEQYRTHLRAMVDDMYALFHAPVLVGQITNLLNLRDRNDGVRRAQQEVWAENPHALPGAVTYDIYPTDGVHYRDEKNMRAFAGRWTFAIRNALYTPNPVERPRLIAIRPSDARRLELVYDRALRIATWDGKPGEKAYGVRITADTGTLTDAAVVATQVAGGTVTVIFSADLSARFRLWYGSGSDGQGKPVLRDAITGIPVPMLLGTRRPTRQED